MMMMKKIGSTLPPMKSKICDTVSPRRRCAWSATVAPGEGRRRRRWPAVAAIGGSTMRPVPAIPDTRAVVPAAMSVAGRRAVFVGLAFLLDQHAAVAAGRDADRDEGVVADQVARSRTARPPAARRRSVNRTVRDGHPDEPEDRPDEGRLAAVQVEDLGGEQATDTEHRDERQQQRHERHAADVEVEDGAQDVVEEDRQQEQAAADQRADEEHEVLDRDVDHLDGRRLQFGRERAGRDRIAAARSSGEGAGRVSRGRSAQSAEPNSSVSQWSRGVPSSEVVPEADRGRARRIVRQRRGVRVQAEGDLVGPPEPVGARLLVDVARALDLLELAAQRRHPGGLFVVGDDQDIGPARGGGRPR